MALRVALLLLGAGGVGSISSNVCFHGASAAESSASTLRPLQLIGGHVRTDRIPLMSLYRPFFAGQAIYLTGADPVMPNSFRNLSKLANHGVSDYVDCTRANPQVYLPCFRDFLRNLTTGEGLNRPVETGVPCTASVAVAGVLYQHFDMWVNPMVRDGVGGLNVSNVWFHGHGLSGQPLECLSGEALASDTRWFWWYDSKPNGLRALERVEQAKNGGNELAQRVLSTWPKGQLCRGHADIYYIPARYLADVAQLADWFHDVHHEAAWATILHMVAGKALASPWPRDEAWRAAAAEPRYANPNYEQLSCFYEGDWNVSNAEDLHSRQCGHKLLLGDSIQRARIAEALLAGTIEPQRWSNEEANTQNYG